METLEKFNIKKFDENFTVDMLLNPQDDDSIFYIEAPSEEINSLIRDFDPEYLVYCGEDTLWQWGKKVEVKVISSQSGSHCHTDICKIEGLKVPHLYVCQFNTISNTSFILLKGEGSQELASLLSTNVCKPHSMMIDYEGIEKTLKVLHDKFNL